MADWFSQLATQALKLADDFTDSLVAQANEAQEQITKEQAKLKEENEQRKQQLSTNIQLPWETEDESRQILSEALMDSIFKLSLNEKNFTHVPPNADDVHFVFADFVATAMRLLQIDANLAHVHSKISPKMDEELFWRNYYCRIIYLRAVCGIDGQLAQETANAQWGDHGHQIIFEADYAPPPAPVMSRGVSESAISGSGRSASSRSRSRTPPKAAVETSVDDDHALLAELGLEDDDDQAAGGGGGDADLGEGEGLADDDDIDLGDLDDLDLLGELASDTEEAPGATGTVGRGKEKEVGELGSYESVGKSDCNSSSNAELEAQIAAELANMSDDD
jgi:hypothetical protein